MRRWKRQKRVNSDDLFFYSAKVLGWFLKIDNLLVLGVIITIYFFWSRRVKLAKRSTIVLGVSLFFFSNLGISFAALRTLEDKYPIPSISCKDGDEGVIVLGGGINPGLIPAQRSQVQLNEAGERLTKALELLNKCPEFRLIYSTFSGSLRPQGISESESAELFFKEQRISPSRLIFENQSRNTFENAKFSSALVDPESQKWILVTSASHSPRAITTFERFGWTVTPYPVDFRSESKGNYFSWGRGQGIENWNVFLHEAIGSAAYALREVVFK
jgi:uncharacterized SAM-binding protein YcdF (DUF218 family)